MIDSEVFPDGKLPGERELAIQFDCGRNTVRSALAVLENEGIVDRCRKKGTTLKQKVSSVDKGCVGIIMRTSGHFYEDVYHELLTGFVDHGYLVHSISTNPIFKNSYNAPPAINNSIRNAIGKLLESQPEIIILDGYKNNEIPYCRELCRYNTVMTDFFLGDPAFKLPGVWLNYEKAGYMAGKYLAEQGCKNPVFFPHYVRLEHRLNFDIYVNHKEKMLADGFRKAIVEYGLNPETAVIESFSTSLKDFMQLIEKLSVLNIVDGFFSADVNISFFIKKLLENQGHIPENISFVGMYNTPWSSSVSVCPFSSIDFNAAGVAGAVLKMAELPMEKRSDVYISPELIIRERTHSINYRKEI